ncbi:MAG: peptide chain release factor N(5)-glutamine methyltransferase [Actinomycetota bacterium]
MSDDTGVSDASTWREVLAEATATLGDAREARFICEHASGLNAKEFTDALHSAVSRRMGLHVQNMVGRRLAGEPLQYVLGRWAFRHLDLLVDRRVLIPRPETELVAQAALEFAAAVHPTRVVVDLGTGSGAIGLSLAHELPLAGTTVWLTDASPDALDVARANSAGIGRAGANVRVTLGDWYAALPESLRGAVDVIVANPPYIAHNDNEVAASVADYEPHVALYSGDDGLAALRTIIDGARQWLSANGVLVLEIGHRQGGAVRELLTTAGLRDVTILHDLAGSDRIATARV